jgi:hypothetical protein
MIDTSADVCDDRGDLGAAIVRATIDDEHSDRLVEFTDAFYPSIELQLPTERGLKEAVLDLGVGESRSFGGAAALTSAFSAWAAQLTMAPIAMAAEVKAATDLRYSQYIELATGVRLEMLTCQFEYVGRCIGIRYW